MSCRITCFTLFDITKTGVLNRAKPADDIEDFNLWVSQRASQCNYDTILQVISLRSQPDNPTTPIIHEIDLSTDHKFGTDYNTDYASIWSFDFEVQNGSVFDDGSDSLGSLYSDCQGVPMVMTPNQYRNLDPMLDITKEKRNIYFVKYTNE
jgi:hypothetical protein